MSDLRAQAEQTLRDICDGHARHRDFRQDCPPCIARIEAFGRGVRDAERQRCAAIARQRRDSVTDYAGRLIAEAIESGADHAD